VRLVRVHIFVVVAVDEECLDIVYCGCSGNLSLPVLGPVSTASIP